MKIARILVTSKCNLSCEYCCNEWEGMLDTFKEISRSQFEDIYREFDGINFTGGEPLIYAEQLTHLIRGMKHKSIRVYTNGILMTDNIFTGLIEAGVTKFEVGLHDIIYVKDKPIWDLMKKYPQYFRLSVNKEYAKTISYHLWDLRLVGLEINLWNMDECDNADTARFRIPLHTLKID